MSSEETRDPEIREYNDEIINPSAARRDRVEGGRPEARPRHSALPEQVAPPGLARKIKDQRREKIKDQRREKIKELCRVLVSKVDKGSVCAAALRVLPIY